MMRTRDAILLARTKLKTRRIRLVVLLVIMSLLFSGLVFIADIASGTIHSLRSFSNAGYGNRFLVQAQPITYQTYGDDALIKQLKPQQDRLIAQKTALAKKLGVQYDPKSDDSLYYSNQQVGPDPSDVQPMLNSSPLATAALNKQNLAIPGISFNDFSQLAKQAGATHTYRSASSSNSSFNGSSGTSSSDTLSVLVNGKENYNNESSQNQQSGPPTGVASIQTLGWSQISGSLLQPFLLEHQTTATGSDGSIPVVAPYSAAEQLLGLSSLPSTATSAQKLQRLTQVRQDIAGKTALLCYRNSASEALLQKAVQQQTDIAANKGNANYTPPNLLYNLPAKACGATTIKSDARSAAEKAADANQQTFNATFDPNAAPVQGLITLRIVGLSPDVDNGAGPNFSAEAVLTSILSSTLGSGWFSPTSAFTSGTIAAQAQQGTIADQPLTQQTYYAEFPTLAAATHFIKQTDCNTNGTGVVTIQGNYDPNDTVATCAQKGKPFTVSPYGNNAGAIAQFQHDTWKFLRFVLLGVVIFAVIIMVGTFGKVIADSRRETAVFRSLGANRLVISQIYLTYTLLVCALVAAIALTLGTIGAEILNQRVSPGLSVSAVLVYNVRDVHSKFSVAGFNGLYLAIIVGLIVVSALISALIPLFLNMRRNPITDMRDE